LQGAIRKGTAFLVQLGTRVYVHHLDESQIKPPDGIQALLDNLDGTEVSAKKEGSPPR